MSENKNCLNEKSMSKIKEAVCIDTNRVYDSCADKDCLEDLRVYFTSQTQCIIDSATNVRCRGSEVLNAFIEVERIPFNRGFYSVDITYFFKVCLDVFTGHSNAPVPVEGLATFSKKCILYGSEGNVKVFSSEFVSCDIDNQLDMTSTNPKAKVQTVDPICLDAKLCHIHDCCNPCDKNCCKPSRLPKCICCCFDGDFDCYDDEPKKAVLVTLGIFTIVQLERDVQMLIPAYDFCMPNKECSCETDNPCEAFRKIQFPVDEFFPPKEGCLKGGYFTGCGCSYSNQNNE